MNCCIEQLLVIDLLITGCCSLKGKTTEYDSTLIIYILQFYSDIAWDIV